MDGGERSALVRFKTDNSRTIEENANAARFTLPDQDKDRFSMFRPGVSGDTVELQVREDGHLHFTQNYLFNTPSGAAAVILGRTSNGWVDWKNKDGKTLSEVKRAESTEE
jgi:hypothetical protein